MTRKRALWLAAMLGLFMVSSGVILAQKGGDQLLRARTMVRTDGDHAWLGVRLNDVTSEKAKEAKLPGEYGAVVARVQQDSPAAKAGIEKEDVILEFAGARVWSAAELRRMLEETPAGRTVELRVSRAGQTRNLSVKLEGRGGDMLALAGPPAMLQVPHVEVQPFEFHFGGMDGLMGGPRLGIEAEDLSSQLACYFGVSQGKGVLVGEVKPGAPAEKAGLKAGDCIVAVDGKEVGTAEELRQALRSESSQKSEYTLSIVRDRRPQTVKVEIEPSLPWVRPETAGDDLEDIEDEISALRQGSPRVQFDAENLRRQTEALRKQVEQQSRQWRQDWAGQEIELQKELRRELLAARSGSTI